MPRTPFRAVRGILTVCSAVLALGLSTAASAGVRPTLVPEPRSLTLQGADAPMRQAWALVCDRAAEDSGAVEVLTAELQAAYGWQPKAKAARTIVLARRTWPAGTDSLTRQQGYELTIAPSRITIAAETACGRYYGVQTLRQIVRGGAGLALPGLVIRDAPRLAIRGVSEDLARGQMPTLETMRATLRELAYYKLNHYQVYLESRFEFWIFLNRDEPQILKSSELAILAREAARHHVALVPVVQTLGHQEWLLRQGEFVRYGETRPPDWMIWARGVGEGASAFVRFARRPERPLPAPEVALTSRVDAGVAVPSAICPVDPRARALMRRLISDVSKASAGSGPWIHCGGDEPSEVGTGRSRAAVERDGFGAVYADFYTDMAGTVRAWGRRMMLYGDVLLAHPDAARRLPKDVVIVDWHYDPHSAFGSVDTLRRAGFDVVACAGMWNWRAFHPDYASAWPNIRGAVAGARRFGGLGAIVASWGDGGAECLNASNWAGYAYLAACAWEGGPPEEASFLDAYARSSFGAGGERMAEVERALGWVDLQGRPWHGRVFARPLTIHRRTEAWRATMQATRERMLKVRAILDAVEPGLTHLRERTGVERLTAERYGLLADRELLLDDLARELHAGGNRPLSESRRIAVAARLRQCADRTTDLAERYRAAWLAQNKPEGVEFLVERLRQQAAVLADFERQAQDGTLSEWRPRGGTQRL